MSGTQLGTCSECCLPGVLALQECDHSQTDSLEDEEIETFYKILTQRKEIDRTFEEATGSKDTLSVDQLVTFLQHQQREEEAGLTREERKGSQSKTWVQVPAPPLSWM